MNEFPMHKMNSSDEDILDISHAGGSGNAGLTSEGAINTSEGRPRDGVFGGTLCKCKFRKNAQARTTSANVCCLSLKLDSVKWHENAATTRNAAQPSPTMSTPRTASSRA